jgi:hypothetical protein
VRLMLLTLPSKPSISGRTKDISSKNLANAYA